jgi:hypothetical protein
MERMLQETASGRTNPIVRWYATAHAAQCGRCGRFLGSLTSMIGELRNEKEAETDRDAIERLAEKIKR